MSEERKTRANWIIDKVLLSLCGALIVITYNHLTGSIEQLSASIDKVSGQMQDISSDLNAMDRRTTLLEYRMNSQPPKQ